MNDFVVLGYLFETSVIAAVRKFEAIKSYHDFAIQKNIFCTIYRFFEILQALAMNVNHFRHGAIAKTTHKKLLLTNLCKLCDNCCGSKPDDNAIEKAE
jgi:hypothetical protein